MRRQFVTTIESILAQDHRLVLLLGDIGVAGFKKSLEQYPDRAYNIGILEQATVGLAAGLAMTGLIPVMHTIAPFIAERSTEQLKNDFCYQRLGGNFVTIGASYDYAALGCTHHCPADVGIMKNLPGLEIVLPGTAKEFDILFRQSYDNGRPTYFRLSEQFNQEDNEVKFAKAKVIKTGSLATVIAVGTALRPVNEACENLDVTILYYTTVAPFDQTTLKDKATSNKILLVEPYYSGVLLPDIIAALKPQPLVIETIGVPKKFLTDYGKVEQHNELIGLTYKNIKDKLTKLIYG